MSYVTQTLAPGEEILTRAHFNWTYSVPALFWFVLGATPIAYVGFLNITTGDVPGDPAWLYGLSAVPAVLGLGVLIGHLIYLQTTEIVVTSSRFVFKTGLISRKSKEVSLNKIEEIMLNQSILGRIFNYGHMTLRGTGVGVIELPDLDNPVQLRRTIEGAKAQLRSGGSGSDEDYNAPPQRHPPKPAAADLR